MTEKDKDGEGVDRVRGEEEYSPETEHYQSVKYTNAVGAKGKHHRSGVSS